MDRVGSRRDCVLSSAGYLVHFWELSWAVKVGTRSRAQAVLKPKLIGMKAPRGEK